MTTSDWITILVVTNLFTILFMWRVMLWYAENMPAWLEAKAYEEKLEQLQWEDVKWLQETNSAATIKDDPRSNAAKRFKAGNEYTNRRPWGLKMKVGGEFDVKSY